MGYFTRCRFFSELGQEIFELFSVKESKLVGISTLEGLDDLAHPGSLGFFIFEFFSRCPDFTLIFDAKCHEPVESGLRYYGKVISHLMFLFLFYIYINLIKFIFLIVYISKV